MGKKILYSIILLSVIVGVSCSSQRDTFTNRLYHNTTARFNAYYLAKEKLQELENRIEDDYQEDYSQLLPVYYPIDSATIDSNSELLEDARSMASKAIDWHKISKWVDPSYFLLGKIDYLEANFDEAKNTFKYLNVNSKQKDVRHISLIQLLKLFVDLKEFEDAAYVIDYLSKEPDISKENKQFLYKTLAYYYESRGETDMIAPALFKTLENTDDKKEISRINFILGQLYQNAGLDAFAFEYYQKSLNGSPSYERTFFAQLFSQQVVELEKSKDFKRVRDYYDDLYKDRKNVEFRDVVLYEKAIFELKQEETEESIRLLTLAAKEPGENERQKGYIYQKLGEIYLHKKNDFLTTKYYLDSALQHFKDTDRNYDTLSAKKEIFDQYATNFELIQKNDSLISLSKLSPEEQEAYVDQFLLQEEERLMREAELASAKKSSGIFDNLLAFGGKGSGSSFYWENPQAMQRGAIEFAKVWGQRPLTDNWRRSNRSFQEEITRGRERDIDFISLEEEPVPNFDEEGEGPAMALPDKESLLMNIPKDDATIEQMMEEMEDAYFHLGKILFFDLKEPDASIGYLHKLVAQFPNSPKKPEAYYTLYLATKENNGNFLHYSRLLNEEFPKSQYTKSVNNPEQVSGTEANFQSSQDYKEAYGLYKEGQFGQARSIIRRSLDNYPLSKQTERLLLLDIMVTGKTESLDLFRNRLENYIQNTDDPELLKLAQNMLRNFAEERVDKASGTEEALADQDKQAEDSDSETGDENVADIEEEPPVYKDNKNQTHIFILTLDPTLAKEAKNLTADLENFHSAKFSNDRLRTGTISLTRENTIVIISPFSNATKAIDYREEFLKSFNADYLSEELKKSSFVISIENFQQLNKRKDLEEYRAFYTKSY